MSKYMTFETEGFPIRELLVEALGDMGFSEVETGENLPLEGWDKSDRRAADVVIRRRSLPGMNLFGDIGFGKSANGLVPIIDDMDLAHSLGRDFLIRLRTGYHEAAARKMAKRLGGTMIRETVGKTVKIRIRF